MKWWAGGAQNTLRFRVKEVVIRTTNRQESTGDKDNEMSYGEGYSEMPLRMRKRCR
jgi:hypothetical protein